MEVCTEIKIVGRPENRKENNNKALILRKYHLINSEKGRRSENQRKMTWDCHCILLLETPTNQLVLTGSQLKDFDVGNGQFHLH